MKPSNLFNSDDRAVSPVIGVILMVAITVILAAVIGTFVLGLGDSLGDSQPTAQLSVDVNEDSAANSATVSIEHTGGDSLESDTVRVIVDDTGNDTSSDGVIDQRLSVGDSVETDSFGGDTTAIGEIRVRLIHTPSDSILLDRTFDVNDLQYDTDTDLFA
ncbi:MULTISPECIES: type IV pilin [Haloferacaceae]|uniref:Type IV pilin n=1 Tax=Halorubrum glutamatedens TaxID=2707018 RepID=A0ABD5QQJ8_9EURY|nr:type IV pilin N-terminal domain-containing protein [Halobellus captivus]